jgi:hypothetical protein
MRRDHSQRIPWSLPTRYPTMTFVFVTATMTRVSVRSTSSAKDRSKAARSGRYERKFLHQWPQSVGIVKSGSADVDSPTGHAEFCHEAQRAGARLNRLCRNERGATVAGAAKHLEDWLQTLGPDELSLPELTSAAASTLSTLWGISKLYAACPAEIRRACLP